MTLSDAVKKVAEEMNLPYDVCHRAYTSAWKFILTKAQGLPLSTDLPMEEFKKLRPNFNMPSLGKFHVTTEEFERTNRKYLQFKKIKEQKNAESKEH